MKSLEERQRERAQRKADNLADSNNASNGGVGAAMAAVANANEALRGLTEEQRDEVRERMAEGIDDFNAGDDYADMSGIGVINPNVLNAEARERLAASDVQQGNMPDASFDPEKGNLNGQAIEKATNGWGEGEEKAKAKPKAAAKDSDNAKS